MIRQETCNQLTSAHSTYRRQPKRMGWDDQMRGLRSIDEFTYRDGRRGCGMIRREVCNKSTRNHVLETGDEDGL